MMTSTDLLASAFATMPDLIRAHAVERPSHLALIEGEETLTYRELDTLVDRAGAALQRDGVAPGDVVAICAPTSARYVAAFIASLRVGAAVSPLSPASTAEALAAMIRDCGARILFVDDAVSAALNGVADSVTVPRISLEGSADITFETWLEPPGASPAAVSIEPEDAFNIIYSSGTTGTPKGIVQPHRMRWGHVRRAENLGYGPNSITIVSTPLYSNTTLVSLIPTLVRGGTAVLMRKFDARGFLELSQRRRATHAMLVPVQYRRIMDLSAFGEYDLASYEMKTCTSAPFSADLKADILARWPGGLVEIFGMTEGGGSCVLAAHVFPNKLHTVGRPAQGHDIRIIDDAGKEAGPGESGEIVGRSMAIMTGYHNQPEKTAESEWYSPEGERFIRTGDVGRFDEDGFLVLGDRKKDMIISGGFNIYPSDLERVLAEHAAVAEAAVVGMPSREWGETPAAFVVLRPDDRIEGEALRIWVNDRVGKMQRLSWLEIVPSLPRSSIGKVLKRELRDTFRPPAPHPDIAAMSTDELTARGLILARHAHERPEAPAILSPNGDRSWRELNARANQLARAFRKHGLQAGDGVAILAHNAPEFVEAWAATQRAGLRVTAVNWHQSANLVAYVVDNSDARALVASSRFAPAAVEAAGRSGKLALMLAFAGSIEGFRDYEEVLAAESEENLTDAEAGSTMLYTSGTTGRPKGVFRRSRPVLSQLTNVVNETAGWRPGQDTALITGPLYHAAPLGINLVIPLNAGVTCVLMDKWDAEETLRLIQEHRATHTHVVPTMMHRMLQLTDAVRAKYDVSTMRWMIHGAAPCPAHVKQAMLDWFGPVLYEYYSSTEGGGVWIEPHEWIRKPGTVGRPVAGVEVQLLDSDGSEVPVGAEGAIYIKAPTTGRFEYYKEPAKTDSSYRGDWYTLGDMGRFDEDGYLFLTGRTAELIISGGVNIYPVEIDEVLIRHEAVADAAVVGVPNEDWGEEIKAVVELKPGFKPDAGTIQSILEFARDQLPGFQRPRSVDFVDTLPRNAAGKVLRQQVREPYWKDRARKI